MEWAMLHVELAPISGSHLRRLLRESGVPLAPLVEGVRQETFEALESSLLSMLQEYERGDAAGRDVDPPPGDRGQGTRPLGRSNTGEARREAGNGAVDAHVARESAAVSAVGEVTPTTWHSELLSRSMSKG